MAKIQLKNTRTHDITLHLVSNDQVSSVTIPAARPDSEDDNKLIHGVAEADGELVAAARKKHAPVKHYFDEGWLIEAKSGEQKSGDKEK
jgi:hypothetical protein